MFDPAPAELRRLNRVISWSVAIHVAAVGVLLATPRTWWSTVPEPREVMRISLGGAPGPTTGGQTNIGGRTVEQVAPAPQRPQTQRPTAPTPAAPTSATAVRAPQPPPPVSTAPPRQPPRPTTTARPQTDAPRTATRPPVTGRELTRGNTNVDTGASGQGAGLASGGRFAGGEASLADFCCPAYATMMLQRIDARWNKNSPDRGTTIMKFTVQRDGRLTDVVVEQSSGYTTMDRAARNALLEASPLLPLPPEYTGERLTVHLRFPYGQ